LIVAAFANRLKDILAVLVNVKSIGLSGDDMTLTWLRNPENIPQTITAMNESPMLKIT
jgi:hypothetical protein